MFTLHEHSLCWIAHSELHWHPIHHILPTTHTGQIRPYGGQGRQRSSFLCAVLQGRVLGYPCIGQHTTSVPSTLDIDPRPLLELHVPVPLIELRATLA